MSRKSMNASVPVAPLPATFDSHTLAADCFHCCEPIPGGSNWHVELDGRSVRLFCPDFAARPGPLRDNVRGY